MVTFIVIKKFYIIHRNNTFKSKIFKKFQGIHSNCFNFFVEENSEKSGKRWFSLTSISVKYFTNDFKKEWALAIYKAICRHIEYANTLKLANNPNRWKVLEACLLEI